ncbi:MAG: GNAT family N-acetyltransferase [Candidatus Nanoarchaeia archaeon]
MIIKATSVQFKDIAHIEYNSGYIWSKYSFEKEQEFAKKLLESELVFLYNYENKTVGYISLRIENNVCEIGMSVHKNYQRRGVGTKLLEYAIQYCKSQNINTILLDVWSENPAVNLYKKVGFKVIEETKKFYENGDSLLKMKLNLEK